jgi:hypothetical protein
MGLDRLDTVDPMTHADELLSRVVRLLEQLEAVEPWAMDRDELETFVESAGDAAGGLHEERRRQLIIAAVAR